MENTKLIYELSKIAKSSNSSQGLIYYKGELTPESFFRRIWAKRAYKKGYCNLEGESESYFLFKINEKGIKLLKNYPQFYLLKDKTELKNLTIKERRKLRNQKRGEFI